MKAVAGLITGCMFWFTGRLDHNRGGHISGSATGIDTDKIYFTRSFTILICSCDFQIIPDEENLLFLTFHLHLLDVLGFSNKNESHTPGYSASYTNGFR